MTAPTVTFLAPPSFDEHDEHDDAVATASPANRPREAAATAGALRMTRGARAAASGMKISDTDIQRCLDAPEDASPDPTTPSRTRFRRAGLTVLAGADGMVLRVDRTGSDRRARPAGTPRPAKRRRRRPA